MSHVRRPVRRTLTRGSIIHATVEQFQFGLATVRLAGNGARLTNLSTIGGEVAVGDSVLVDYSAGIKPIVRPLFLEEELEDVIVADSPVEKVEAVDNYGGCFGWHLNWIEPEIWIQHGETYTYHIGPKTNLDFSYSNTWWEDGDFGVTDQGGWWGRTYVTIPVSGKYLIQCGDENNHWYHMPPFGGWHRLRVLKNGTVIGEDYMPDAKDFVFDYAGLNVTMIQEFEAGDKISFDYMFTIPEESYWLGNYYTNPGEGSELIIKLIPGTGVTNAP